MLYLLDTNICSYILRKRPFEVLERLEKATEQGDEVGLSVVTASELLYGAYRKQHPRLIELVRDFLELLPVYPFDLKAAEVYGEIRAILEKKGCPIGPYDLQIAAHAISKRAVLVTNNEREFRRVPGLRLENWTNPAV